MKNLHEQIKVDYRNSLPLDNADEHRSRNNHENICLDNQIQCDYCGYMDPQDVRKIFSHFFSCYPLFFSLERKLSFTHDNGGLFDIYISGLSGPFNYYSTDSPYGKEVYDSFKLFIEKYDEKTQTDNYSLNPNYTPTEEDVTAIKRALLIPKWYLRKYFEYIVDSHNGLYQYVVKCANPGREQRLKQVDVKIYLNCAVCQDPIIDDDSE